MAARRSTYPTYRESFQPTSMVLRVCGEFTPRSAAYLVDMDTSSVPSAAAGRCVAVTATTRIGDA